MWTPGNTAIGWSKQWATVKRWIFSDLTKNSLKLRWWRIYSNLNKLNSVAFQNIKVLVTKLVAASMATAPGTHSTHNSISYLIFDDNWSGVIFMWVWHHCPPPPPPHIPKVYFHPVYVWGPGPVLDQGYWVLGWWWCPGYSQTSTHLLEFISWHLHHTSQVCVKYREL